MREKGASRRRRMQTRMARREKNDDEEEDRLVERNVVGAEIRGIQSIMEGSYLGQYHSLQTPQFTLDQNRDNATFIMRITSLRASKLS